jgi:hypothetical protein
MEVRKSRERPGPVDLRIPCRLQHMGMAHGPHTELWCPFFCAESASPSSSESISPGHACCEIGIESTVAKLVSAEGGKEGELVVLRRGAVTEPQLIERLAANGLGHVR